MSKKRLLHLVLLVVLTLGLSSCESMRGTKIYRFWHNMNARFNGYFNAKEKMLDVETTLFDNKVDNFNRVIDVFAITDDKSKDAVKNDMEIVIKKSSTVITKHGSSKWVKNCYFLIGKAEFYKRDFFTAIETFEYVNEKYPDDEVGQESKVWLMQCYLEQGKLNDVQSMIATDDSDKNFPVLQKPFLHLVEAQYYVRSNEYKPAIKKMEAALPLIKDRQHITRYMFILGQLYQALDSNAKASFYYALVIKRHPVYELAFQANLQLAEVSNNENEVEKNLLKLLKDERNLDYRDQIYYTLAKVELKKGNKSKALEYLQLSTKYSKKNNNQKALSFKTEAEIYFGIPVYPYAKMFYDSAAKFVTKDYPDYDAFKARQAVLSDLISNLITVHDQDSLLKLSAMDTASLNKYIDQAIEDKKQKMIQLANQQANQQNNSMPTLNIPSADNSFGSSGKESYFYNANALAQGLADFQSKWGNRARTDDWRRKNRPITNIETNSGTDTASGAKQNSEDNATAAPNPKKIAAQRQKYYADIPFTPSQKNIANNKIQEALYSMGNIYYNGLGDLKKAEETFEDLLKRYPNGTYVVQAHYNLYKVYADDSNKTKSEYHKNIVLNNYPGTIYAQLIVNPDQLRQQYFKSKKNVELENAYTEAYNNFLAGNCDALANDVQQAGARFKEKNYLKSKFDYLLVVCRGKKDTLPNFIASLKSYLKKYPGEEISRQVQDEILYLEGLQRKEKNQQMSKDTAKDKSIVMGTPEGGEKVEYQKTENQPHHFIIIIPSSNDINVVKTALANYNDENYQSQQLSIKSFALGADRQIVYVTNYKDYDQALQYYKELENVPTFYPNLALKFHQEFIISDTNFSLFMKHKDVEGYLKFFKENYLQ